MLYICTTELVNYNTLWLLTCLLTLILGFLSHCKFFLFSFSACFSVDPAALVLPVSQACWLRDCLGLISMPWLHHCLWCLSGSKREDYQNCSVLYCVLKLCTVISTLRWAVLTVLWIGFCYIGPISLCIDIFVFICVYFVCFCFILYSCCIIVSMVGWTWWDWSVILRTYLPSVLWHCWLGHFTRKNLSPIWPIMCLVGC